MMQLLHSRRRHGEGMRTRASRRGAALLMALFAIGVATTAGTSFVKSRDRSVMVGRSMSDAASARLAAAEGLAISREVLSGIFRESDATLAAQWRAQLADGVLLTNYHINGATLNVTVADLATGAAPTITTTEFSANITVSVGDTHYQMSAQMSLQSLIKGQYAIFANKLFRMEGNNFVGRWERAPTSPQKHPINLGTQALRSWFSEEGAYFGESAYFEDQAVAITGSYSSLSAALSAQPTEFTRAARAGYAGVTINAEARMYKFDGGSPTASASWSSDAGTFATKQAYLYYPSTAETVTVTGGSADEVELVRLSEGESIRMPTPPNEPPFVPGTTYSGNRTYSGQTLTLNPIRVKCNEFVGIPYAGGDLTLSNNSVVTLKSGVYRVDDKFKLLNSRLIIDGNVKIVMKARMWFDLDAKSFEMTNSAIELKGNSQLLLFIAYDMVSTGSWVGADYTCPSGTGTAAAGDPHRKKWLNQWTATACDPTPPMEPRYLEPWRVRIFPDPAFLSSIFLWDFNSSSIIGSIYMPTNPVILRGNTEIYGRIAANHVILRDEASFFYDHALDDITGLTEGAPPPRGGTQQIPTRIQINF